ncbi:MAG TPA: CPBP family intramembrane glutamic endopeptidase [Hyphomicrobiaceae bacterium]|nr:CPBP family intramembrane glutamic endopeptidase [Hyphomicrobiaceae bacterium]
MGSLEGWVRSLSPAAEFCLVVGAAFAIPVGMSWWITFGDVARAQALQLTEGELRALIAEEALLLMLLGWFLRVRGWSVEHFAAYPSRRELVMAAWLTAVSFFVWVVPWFLLAPANVEAASSTDAALSWPGILAVSILNPLFEELFLCAYMLAFLASRSGPGVAVAISLLVRLSFHTYQGAVGLLAIGLLGLVLSIFYLRTQRLWPVLIAHGLLDFIALAIA